MSDALTFAELEGQNIEALPARTVLSLLDIVDLGGGDAQGGAGGTNTASSTKGDVLQTANGGEAKGGAGALQGLLSQGSGN